MGHAAACIDVKWDPTTADRLASISNDKTVRSGSNARVAELAVMGFVSMLHSRTGACTCKTELPRAVRQ